MKDTAPEKWISIGRVMGAHGVRGGLRVQLSGDDIETVLALPHWWITPGADRQATGKDRAAGRDRGKGRGRPASRLQNGPRSQRQSRIQTQARQRLALLEGRRHRQGVVVLLQGVESREAAQALYGATIEVPRKALPQSDDTGYYWADLVGCQAISEDDQPLGEVTALFETGANDVLVVRTDAGDERLFPFTEEVVRQVSLDEGRIVIHLLEGL